MILGQVLFRWTIKASSNIKNENNNNNWIKIY